MKKKLRKIVESVTELPTLPKIATALLEIIDDPKSSASDLNRVIKNDPALSSKILKLVNSAFYALPKKINNLSHAIVILGFSVIKSIALSVSVYDMFSKSVGEDAFDKYLFWQHSIASACICRALAKKVGGVDEESAFVFGLLHDIGKLVIDKCLPDEMGKILKKGIAEKKTFFEAEQGILEGTHADVGGWLTEKWNLAPELVETIKLHHSKEEISENVSVALIQFSNFYLDKRKLGSSGNYGRETLNKSIWNTLHISKDNLALVVESIDKELEEAKALIEMSY